MAIPIEPRIHAVQRSRELCARALGYAVPARMRFGLGQRSDRDGRTVVLIHGTSRADKLWPDEHWVALGQRLIAQGHTLALPHGSDEEEARSRALAGLLGGAAAVWPRLRLDQLTDRMAGCGGAIGVDSGLSHIAVALDLPHVQIYNFDTAWRTGPVEFEGGRQCSVFAHPAPAVDAVWQAWQAVTIAA